MPEIQLVTDCEGPLALNDNAYELCRDFILPDGDRFYRQVCRYDDLLGGVIKKAGHNLGDALRLILPFLMAYGLTGGKFEEYCEQTVKLVPDAVDVYRFLHSLGFPIFEISTSYRQFAEAAGLRMGFAPERIFATDLDLDRYALTEAEAEALKGLKSEIVGLPELELPAKAARLEELPPSSREAAEGMERIFREVIAGMEIGRIYREITPIGGEEKARALEASLGRTGLSLKDTMYVGDSINDVAAFEMVRAGGGAALAFNGNAYAVNAAEFVVVADNAWPVALLAAIFRRWGKEGLIELVTSSRAGHQKIVALPEAVVETIMAGLGGRNFNFYLATSGNREKIARESLAMRVKLRGEDVAGFG